MREYCLISKGGTVLNMAMSYKSEPPVLTEYQIERGYEWVPVDKVSTFALRQYEFWNKRP